MNEDIYIKDGYALENAYYAIPGTIVQTVLEFPEYDKEGKSLIIVLDDVMSLSYSIYRSKIRVIPLGQNKTRGFGLGTRLVAGSMIRSVFTTDKFTDIQSKIYIANATDIEARLKGINDKIPKGIPNKDIYSIMKDDLGYFNIHTLAIPEYKDAKSRYETIYGVTIINTGQVYSVEDLITESTFSFEALGVKSSTGDLTAFRRGFSDNASVTSVSEILKN